MARAAKNQELRDRHEAFFAEMETLRELLSTAGQAAAIQDDVSLEPRMRKAIARMLALQRNITELEK